MVLNSRFRPALRNGIPEEVDFSLRQVFIPRPDKAAAIDANRSTTDASETDLGPTPEAPPVGEPSRIRRTPDVDNIDLPNRQPLL